MLQQSKNLERKQNNQILQDSLSKYLKQSNEIKRLLSFWSLERLEIIKNHLSSLSLFYLPLGLLYTVNRTIKAKIGS